MRNPLKRRPRDEAKPTLRERAAALKATAAHVIRRRRHTSAEAVAAMAPHHPGMVPYPPGAPTSLLAVDLFIRQEAARLLELADAEHDRRYAEEAIGLDEAGTLQVVERLNAELRIRALAEAADDVDPPRPIDWHSPPVGYMAYPAITPTGFLNIAEALALEAERLHGIAEAEFARRREAYRPAGDRPSEADWSGDLRRALRVDAWAALAASVHAEFSGDALSEPGLILYRTADGATRRRPVAEWVGYMALRLYHIARSEEARASSDALADESDQDADALRERLRRDLRLDALHDLAFRSHEVFEASRDYGVGDRWRYDHGDAATAELDADLLALEAEFRPAHAAVAEAHAAYHEVWDRYEDPPVPSEMRVWGSDWIHGSIPRTAVRTLETVRGKLVTVVHYGEAEVAQMRGRRCLRPMYGDAGELQPDGSRAVPDARAQARVDAIVAAWDRWRAEIADGKDALGLPGLFAAYEVARDRRAPIVDRMRATPARSLAGLGVKARIAFALGDDTDPKRTGLRDYGPEDPEAFVYDVAGDALAITAALATGA